MKRESWHHDYKQRDFETLIPFQRHYLDSHVISCRYEAHPEDTDLLLFTLFIIIIPLWPGSS